jgi:hypothetical protein
VNWPAVAATASAISAFLSFCALLVTCRIAAKQGKVLEFNNAIDLVKQLGEAERRVKAADDKDKESTFRDLLNLLETLAMLYLKGRITKAARDYTKKYLIEAMAWIEVDDTMRMLIERSFTGMDTFADLAQFRNRHRKEIDRLVQFYHSERASIEPT